MSKPGDAVAQGTQSGKTATGATEPTFEQQVNEVVSKLKANDDGGWEFPADVEASEAVKYSAMLEKRRRDTESALSKSRLKLKTEEEMRKKLEQRVAEQVRVNLSPEQAEELETLKYENPDSWRRRMNELEQEASTTIRSQLDDDYASVSQQAELDRRAAVLAEFNAHSDVQITDDTLAKDIPPRIVKKLEKGKITFEEFLQQAHDFIVAPKKVGGAPKKDAEPNLSKVGGGAEPSAEAEALHEVDTYANAVF